MTVQTVNITKAKTHLSRFVDQAAAGEEIIITRAGKPVARLVTLAANTQKSRKLGLAKGRFTIPEDFDAPLSDSALRKFCIETEAQ